MSAVCVVGLGGIGGILAGLLTEAGHDVACVARPATAEAVRARGLRIRDRRGERAVPVRLLDPGAGETFDLVLLGVQPDQVEAAARESLPLLAPGGALVVLQNGLCEPRVARVAGEERTLGAVMAFGASSPEPGYSIRTSEGGFLVGRLDGQPDERLLSLSLLLSAAGEARITDNLMGARWSKLAINCAVSSLGTLGGDRLGPLLSHAFVRRLALEVMSETVEVATASGVVLEKVAGVPLARLSLPASAAGLAARHAALLALGFRYRRLRSSMLAALERGKAPAVDFLNGEVVEHGSAHGIRTPVNEEVRRAVHALASGAMRPGLPALRSVWERTR